MIICAQNNIIKWYTFSKDFPFWSLKYGKSKISENTVVGEYFHKNRKYLTPEVVFADDWFEIKFDKDRSREFFEQCLYGTDGFVLSIIWEK